MHCVCALVSQVHLILWHLAQHVAFNSDTLHAALGDTEVSLASNASALATHPGNVSYKNLFSALDLDGDKQVN